MKKHTSTDEKLTIVKLYEKGRDIEELSKASGVCHMTIYRWVKEYRQNGTLDKRNVDGRGRPSKIDGDAANYLLDILKLPASLYGFETNLWNTERVRQVCKSELGIVVSRMAVWRFFRKIQVSKKGELCTSLLQ